MFVSRQQLELLDNLSGNVIYFSEDENTLVSGEYTKDFSIPTPCNYVLRISPAMNTSREELCNETILFLRQKITNVSNLLCNIPQDLKPKRIGLLKGAYKVELNSLAAKLRAEYKKEFGDFILGDLCWVDSNIASRIDENFSPNRELESLYQRFRENDEEKLVFILERCIEWEKADIHSS